MSSNAMSLSTYTWEELTTPRIGALCKRDGKVNLQLETVIKTYNSDNHPAARPIYLLPRQHEVDAIYLALDSDNNYYPVRNGDRYNVANRQTCKLVFATWFTDRAEMLRQASPLLPVAAAPLSAEAEQALWYRRHHSLGFSHC